MAVIGGGIGRLTTALALVDHHGRPVTVQEGEPGIREIGTQLNVWPTPSQVFDRPGIGEALGCGWDDGAALAPPHMALQQLELITRGP